MSFQHFLQLVIVPGWLLLLLFVVLSAMLVIPHLAYAATCTFALSLTIPNSLIYEMTELLLVNILLVVIYCNLSTT